MAAAGPLSTQSGLALGAPGGRAGRQGWEAGRGAAWVLAAASLSFLCVLLAAWPQDFSFLHPEVWAHQTLSHGCTLFLIVP